MTSTIFAPAAVSCLVDGRKPQPHEIDELASKIWFDVYQREQKICWGDVDKGSRLYLSIQSAALASLGASSLTSDEPIPQAA